MTGLFSFQDVLSGERAEKKDARHCQARSSFVLHFMDAPENASANTLALPNAPPAITLGQALPFALAFEARRRQAADERAARKLARLKSTLRRCEALRRRLAALCDAATAASASGTDGDDARDGRVDANAARELMLEAARGASRARGESREGKHAADREAGGFETANEEDERASFSATRAIASASASARRSSACARCETRASETFAFVREARAFRLAELAVAATERTNPASPPGGSGSGSGSGSALVAGPGPAASPPRLRRAAPASAARARTILRGADDPPASFAAGTLLLELVGAGLDGDAASVSRGAGDAIAEAREPKPRTRERKPLLPFGLTGAARAREAKERVAAAARAFAGALSDERAATTRATTSRLHDASDTFFRRDTAHAFSSDALRRDVLAALVAAAAPFSSPETEIETSRVSSGGGTAERASASVASARLARVALAAAADTDALAGHALVLCASRIREGVVALRERRFLSARVSSGKAPAAPAATTPPGRTRATRDAVVGDDEREPVGSLFQSARARRTLDEFSECQRLGVVFSVAERAAHRLRASTRRSAAAASAASEGLEASTRAALDAARAAAEAAIAPDHANADAPVPEPLESTAVRLIGPRAIRLHAMVCVALGETAPGTRA